MRAAVDELLDASLVLHENGNARSAYRLTDDGCDTFDRIVIRTGHYLRGREPEDLHRLLQEGMAQSKHKPAIRVIPESRDAIHHAIKYARKKELVVTLADRVPDDIRFVQEFRDAK